MKRFFLTLLTTFAMALTALSAQNPTSTLTGRLVATDGRAVDYASLLLTPAGEQFTPGNPNHQGGVSDAEGHFTFTAPDGDYQLKISCIGYKNLTHTFTLAGPTDLGDITLADAPEAIEAITVTSPSVRREADRYVMTNLSESTLAKGRDSYELLKLAPGVWADDNGSISINGKSGVKVLINEREVRMTGDQLMSYLRSLPAENLQKIEIIPQSGADYDADSAAGVIKITLRRQRDGGTSGSVSLAWLGSTIAPAYNLSPSANINHKSGRLNLYGNINLSDYSVKSSEETLTRESTHYDNGAELNSTTSMESSKRAGGGMLGAIWDLSERSSLGVEYNMWHNPAKPDITQSTLDYTLGNLAEHHESRYEQLRRTTNQSVTANYILSLDDRGSTFKLIADWANNTTSAVNNNTDRAVHTQGGVVGAPIDSLYRNSSWADYSYYTLTAAVEKKVSDATTISFGAKYTLTDNYSSTDYDYKLGEEWVALGDYNTSTDYREHIAALYGIYSTRLPSGLSLSAGLRGEITLLPVLNQRYGSLFPHLNFSQPLNANQTVILAGSYKRSIRRPSFWNMNPVRTQLSEYSYQVGNPNLLPVYGNELTLSGVFFYRYTLSLGAFLQDGIISQMAMVDEADPSGRTLKYIHENLNNLYQYYIQLSVPTQLTPWWSLNGNLLGVMLDQRIKESDTLDRSFTLQAYAVNTFTLPQNWYVDVTGSYMSDAKIGNLKQLASGNVSLSVKKVCLNNKLTLSLAFNNLLDTSHQKVLSEGPGFAKSLYSPSMWVRSVNIGVRYNFQSGKMFRARSVESGAADEKSRIGN